MRKIEAVESIGPHSLLLPAWVKAALAANDRLKLYLSLLQAAWGHAANPSNEIVDLSREASMAGLDAAWLHDLVTSASLADGEMLVSGLPALADRMSDDLATMARPLTTKRDDSDLARRVQWWRDQLGRLTGDKISETQLVDLTRGQRRSEQDDSLHLLIMDLHRALNRLSETLSVQDIDGAHVWELKESDQPLVAAFMRGLHRTSPLKFDHPGLDTAATRDGERLLIQNDIGTNDVHVLVIQVQGTEIALTYSDLHRPRFEFFQSLLSTCGATWSELRAEMQATLNQGKTFTVGTATFRCDNLQALEATLETLASQIVYLIDWNRARKRLLEFTDKSGALEVLRQAARREVGHMGFLKAGGDHLIFAAMRAADEGAFRIGERLDTVLGPDGAREYLVDVLQMAAQNLLEGRPVALVADEARLLLARRLRRHEREFALIEEHAAYCHALAQAVSDALAHGIAGQDDSAAALSIQAMAARAKLWERQADHLVMRAREEAMTRVRWRPMARLLETSDDVADAIEEAAFLISLVAQGHDRGWSTDVRQLLTRLAQTVLWAIQEYVKALAISRAMDDVDQGGDGEEFLQSLWGVLRSERQCDELLRAARRAVVDCVTDAPSLILANDLAMSLELASDRLLAAGYALRDLVFERTRATS